MLSCKQHRNFCKVSAERVVYDSRDTDGRRSLHINTPATVRIAERKAAMEKEEKTKPTERKKNFLIPFPKN